MLKKNEIALIGPYPPPLGGVSVHIERISQRLAEKGIKINIYSETKIPSSSIENINFFKISNWFKWWCKYLVYGKEKIMHCHSNIWNFRFFLSLLRLKGVKVVFTFHSLRDEWENIFWTRKLRIKLLLQLASYNIIVNEEIKDKLIKFGAPPPHVHVINDFILPISTNNEKNLPKDVEDFIRFGEPIIVSNGANLKFFQGADLYGVDMMLKLAKDLKKMYENVKVLVFLGEIGDQSYFRELKKKIIELNLQKNFKFVIGRRLTSIFPDSTLFIRPTNTDGESVSLREALHFKIPSLASDVTSRAEGTVLFKNRDINDLILKVKDVLDNHDWYKKKVESERLEESFERIMKVYRKLNK